MKQQGSSTFYNEEQLFNAQIWFSGLPFLPAAVKYRDPLSHLLLWINMKFDNTFPSSFQMWLISGSWFNPPRTRSSTLK